MFLVCPEPRLLHPRLYPGHLHTLLSTVRQRGDCQHRAGGVQRGLRPLGCPGGESGGEELGCCEGDGGVHGGGGEGEKYFYFH